MMSAKLGVKASAVLAAVVGSGVLGIGAVAAPDAEDQRSIATHDRIVKAATPAMVTITFLLDLGEQFGGGEQEYELTGFTINSEGLVVTSSLLSGGFAAQMGMQANPRDLKIKREGESEGSPATILFRNSDLDLCWIKPDAAPAAAVATVDLANPAAVKPGQSVYTLAKLGEFFGGGWHMFSGSIAAVVSTPRELYLPSDLGPIGLPVFDASGAFVGMTIAQQQDAEDQEGAGVQRFNTVMQEGGLAVLPASQIADATKRAIEAAAAETPADGTDPE